MVIEDLFGALYATNSKAPVQAAGNQREVVSAKRSMVPRQSSYGVIIQYEI